MVERDSLDRVVAEVRQIVWWCTAETYTQSLDGKHIKMLDDLRITAKNAAWPLTDATMASDQRRFADQPIPR